jgi:hypothetical protein
MQLSTSYVCLLSYLYALLFSTLPIYQAAVAFERAESDRLTHTESALRQFCLIEKQALEARLRLLASFETGAISPLDAEGDVRLFASRGRDSEGTRGCSHALKMLDWDYKTRLVRQYVSMLGSMLGSRAQHIPFFYWLNT